MKKSLLFLGLLGLTTQAQAQIARWTVLNKTNVVSFSNYIMDDINTVSANVAWGLCYDTPPAGARAQSLTFMRTNNAAGTEFDFNNVSGSTGFEAASIFGVTNQIALTAMFNSTNGGGEILRTTNGGQVWTKVSGSNFAAPAGFNNWVHMFDANEGVSFGDPNTDASGGTPYFEVLRTTNGGVTWTRVPAANLPAPIANANEGGLVRSYFALKGTNTIWASTSRQSPAGPCRILKSTDRGVTWTAYSTPLTSQINRIAFKDALNGIAFNTAAAPVVTNPLTPGTINVIRTTDGGVTWSAVTPVNSATGKFYSSEIDAVPATGNVPGFYVSSGGSRVPNATGTAAATDFGSSTSLDGITWKDIDNAVLYTSGGLQYRQLYLCMDVISNTEGYAGGFLDPNDGSGGIYEVNAATPLPTRTAATDKVALNAYPNPSTGIFEVRLESGVKTETQLTVTDALGRQVYTRTLSPSMVNSNSISVDLTKEKTGVYVIELRNAEGVSQKKLVIQ